MSENRVTLLPLINTSPADGLSRVPMIFSSVVFPEPDGPLNTTKLFLTMDRVTSWTALTLWLEWPRYHLKMPYVLIIV